MLNMTRNKYYCMEKKLFFPLLLLLVIPNIVAAEYYIRDGGPTSGCGTSWSNACDDLNNFASLQRGETYWIADGNYAPYVFDDGLQGTTYITIKKATESNHGPGSGWQSSYGDGQAVFTEEIDFLSGYYLWDGVTGSGGDIDSYGFKIIHNGDCSTSDRHESINIPPMGSNGIVTKVTVSHTAMIQGGFNCGSGHQYQKCINGYARTSGESSGISISNNYMANAADTIFMVDTDDWIIEDNYIVDTWGLSTGVHGDVIQPQQSTNVIVRGNLFKHNDGILIGYHEMGNDNWDIYNNIIIDHINTHMIHETETNSATNTEYHHNMVFNSLCGGGFVDINQPGEAYNNLFYDTNNCFFTPSITHDYNAWISSTNTDSSEETNGIDISAPNPFIDSAAEDFRLKSDAPVIDQGYDSLSSMFNTDRNGITRPQGDGWDMGAYEHHEPKYVADHTVAKEDVIRSIPQEYIDYARNNFHIAYQHSSHGTHVSRGMYGLEQYKSGDEVLFAVEDEPGDTTNVLDFNEYLFDSEAGCIASYGVDAQDLTVGTRLQSGVCDFYTATQEYLSVNSDINVVMYSWCSITNAAINLVDDEGNPDYRDGVADDYIEAMEMLISQYPNMYFIFMTGHAEGSPFPGNEELARQRAQIITDFCDDSGYFCLDYYDIDTHDMDDNYWPDADDNGYSGTYGGNFYQDWQDAHSEGVDWFNNIRENSNTVFPGAHNTQHITANRKAYAMWWILARLAGYQGGGTPEPPPPECQDASDCTNLDCQIEICPSGSCIYTPESDGTIHGSEVCCSGTAYTGECCDDGDCSGGDICQNHVCTSAQPTCQSLGYVCCSTCQGTHYSDYDDDCASLLCCDSCQSSAPGEYISMWKFDGDLTDENGVNNGNPAGGAVEYDTGRSGQAISLDGTSDGSYVNADRDSSLSGMPQFTIAGWARKNTPDTGGVLLVKHVTYRIDIGASNINTYIFTTSGRNDLDDTNAPVQDTEWHHYALTYDGSAMRLYIDGDERTSSSGISGNIVDSSADRDLLFGKDPWGNTFNGLIDDVVIYNEVLDATEIQNLYTGQQQTYHRADDNPQDCIISTNELIAFMNRWRVSIADVPMREMMEAIELWKVGTGCP